MSAIAVARPATMKAIVQRSYGSPDVLEFTDIDRPLVGDGDVLVRVRAASVNPADWHLMRGLPYIIRAVGSRMGFGLRGPKADVLGLSMAGEVEAIGPSVTQLRPGDEVYGEITGAFAEYLRAPEPLLAPKPVNLTFEQAAAMPLAATTALQGIRDHARIQPGQTILINGASGGVGHFAVQIAKTFGAEVTAVCSTRNVEMVRSIGADNVIDYRREDFCDGRRRYDVILDLVGNRSLADRRRALSPEGLLLLSYGGTNRWLGPFGDFVGAAFTSRFVSQRTRPFEAKATREDLIVLKDLVESGKLRPVIDRTYPLAEAADAIRYVENGHARGKVLVTI